MMNSTNKGNPIFLEEIQAVKVRQPLYVHTKIRGESKKFSRSGGYGMKIMWAIFKPNMLTYQSKANLDEKILFDKFTQL